LDNIVEKLRAITETANLHGLDPEAYAFVTRGLSHTIGMTGGEKRHVSGVELTRGIKDLLQKECGPMAPWLLKQWGINGAMDIGTIVFDLVGLSMLSKRDEDTIEDFREGLDPASDFPDDEEIDVNWNLMPVWTGSEAI